MTSREKVLESRIQSAEWDVEFQIDELARAGEELAIRRMRLKSLREEKGGL